MLTLYETQCHSGHAFACTMAREYRGEPADAEADRVEAAAAISGEPKQQTTSVGENRTSNGVTEVALRGLGGGFIVPVEINDSFTLDFMLDSGAADVSIPADVVMTLVRLGTIKGSDFLGTRIYRLADGSAVPSKVFRIRKLTLGGRQISNVTGAISSASGPLLLGQSFLTRFKSWSIDNRRRVLVLE